MNYSKKTVYDADVKGKKVLLRCDFNVPRTRRPVRSPAISESSPPSPPSSTCSSRARQSLPAPTSASPRPPLIPM